MFFLTGLSRRTFDDPLMTGNLYSPVILKPQVHPLPNLLLPVFSPQGIKVNLPPSGQLFLSSLHPLHRIPALLALCVKII